MSKATANTEATAFAIDYMGRKFPIGGDVSVMRVSTSKSGMSHRLKVLAPSDNGSVVNVSYYVAELTGYRYDACTGDVVMRGCGMDMGAALAMELSKVLHGDAYALSHRSL